jgi:hypothetical protein
MKPLQGPSKVIVLKWIKRDYVPKLFAKLIYTLTLFGNVLKLYAFSWLIYIYMQVLYLSLPADIKTSTQAQHLFDPFQGPHMAF